MGTIVLAYDATKDHNEHELQLAVNEIRMRGDILLSGDSLIVLGVVHSIPHPMGYHTEICSDSIFGTNARTIEEEVSKKVDMFANMLIRSAQQCSEEKVSIDVKVTAGMPMKKVILQEALACKATCVVLDRQLRKDLKFYTKQIPCKVALILDSLSVEVLRSFTTTTTDVSEEKLFYSLGKPVPLSADNPNTINSGQFIMSYEPDSASSNSQDSHHTVKSSLISSSSGSSVCNSSVSYVSGSSSMQLKSGDCGQLMASFIMRSLHYHYAIYWIKRALVCANIEQQLTQPIKLSSERVDYGKMHQNKAEFSLDSGDVQLQSTKHHSRGENNPSCPHNPPKQKQSSDAPVLCAGCGMRTILSIKEAIRFKYTEIQAATSDFSKDQLVGEGGCGHVYRGRLKDGQVIAAKVRKEGSTQGATEFSSEVYILSLTRHKNIVMLLGYCIHENHTILVYEYICNNSLDWHLFGKSATVLEWHRRRAIAMGIAKGLRFLHEECRGSPIIHRDLRPSNILLTHDYVPMLGDFGLAKWKTGEEAIHTRIIGTLGYLAPEYAESGFVSMRTDVYSFGIVLLQLISGRKVVNESEGQQQFLLQWAEPLIEKLALHELIDPRIGESYDTYEVHNMAKTAYLCVRRSPEMRPSMAEVVGLLDGKNSRVHDLADQFIPHYMR